MTPDPHIALAAANISIDASLRIAELLASRPVDAELMAEVLQIAHEADVKVRALLTPPAPTHGVATTDPDDALLCGIDNHPGRAFGQPRIDDSYDPNDRPARTLRDASPDFSTFPLTPLPDVSEVVGAGAEDVTITAAPTYPDPTGWIRALRGPAPSTAPTDRRLQVLARLVDVAGAAVGLEDFVASTRAEYPDVFADLDEHLRQVRAGIAAESGPADEDGWPVQHTELCRSRGAFTIAESWWCRCSGELAEYHSPGGRVDVPNGQGVGLDEPPDSSLWAQTLDRAQVAALAGERPSLAVQTEPREAGWLRDLVEAEAEPTPMGPFRYLQATIEPSGDLTLNVVTEKGRGLFRSTDEGVTWTIEATS